MRSDRARAFLLLACLPAALGWFVACSRAIQLVLGTGLATIAAGQLLGVAVPAVAALAWLRPREGWSLDLSPSLGALLALALWPALLWADAFRARWLTDPRQEEMFAEIVAGNGLLPLLLALGVLAPLAEELLFRGTVLPVFARAWGGRAAVPLSAALFAAFHLSAAQIVVPFLLGLVLGWLRLRTGSLWACVAAHAAHNAATLAAMKHDLVSLTAPPVWWVPASLAASALAALAVRRYTRRA